MYAVILAHKEGAATERILTNTIEDTMDAVQPHVDRWTRQHGHGPTGTDHNGFYAYADRITRPTYPARLRICA
jgi:hypothetical protein